MTAYVPTDHPQSVGWIKQVDPSRENHEKQYRTNGPPPRNYHVERRKRKVGTFPNATTTMQPRYINESVTNDGGSWNHPFSPDGLKAIPAPVVEKEFLDSRPKFRGYYQPPIEYQPGEWLWRYQPTWQAALAMALAAQGVKDSNNKPLTAAYIEHIYQQLKKDKQKFGDPDNYILYHPGTRDSMIFKDEPACALVAREIAEHFSLVIICPFVHADGTGWNRLWNTHNRPPIQARFSTGTQQLYTPVVLGCLPIQNRPRDRAQDVRWFAMQPSLSKQFPNPYATAMWGKRDIAAMSRSFGGPTDKLEPHVFLWALTTLHRRIVMGKELSDNELAPWIWQYSTHLVSVKNSNKRVPFKFNKSLQYGGQHFTFHNLTAWIMSRNFTFGKIWIGHYANLWDEGIDAQLQYRLNKSSENWTAVINKTEPARRIPAWDSKSELARLGIK